VSRTLHEELEELHAAGAQLKAALIDAFRPLAVWLLEHPRAFVMAAWAWASVVILLLVWP
jgi:hypothetical protein